MKKLFIFILTILSVTSCDYLDVVPDNIATIDHAFNMRTTAERFLFTCYSYMPTHGTFDGNVAHSAGDEFWLPERNSTAAWYIARGFQRVNNPYMNYWQGAEGGRDLFEAIRQCNIFLENIDRVPDMSSAEKDRWRGEVLFLKAYYHFYLLRMFGPIPLIKENVPVGAEFGDVYPMRNTIDDCFTYVTELIDEALPLLPDEVYTDDEFGRITKAVAYSQKAIILTEAASPLFNGNRDYIGFKNLRGEELFNPEKSMDKWQIAAAACKTALDFCDSLNYKLYEFKPDFFQYQLSDTMTTQMSIRGSVTETWNSEVIWGNTISHAGSIQTLATPRGLDPQFISNGTLLGYMAPTMKMVELFYSENGVPIEDDEQYNYGGRWDLGIGSEESRLYIKEGYVTANIHFKREPRFYASLGFDGAIWYGHGRLDDSKPADLLYVSAKKGQPASAQNSIRYSVTGYWPKKLVYYNNTISSANYSPKPYAWPEIRLSNLYLLYAEVLNEANGAPNDEAFDYVDRVRSRAGLKTVKESWSQFSRRKDHETYAGFQRIVHRERMIELAFEGQRFWDLRRWKEATTELNKPIIGWDLEQEDPQSYYRQKILFNQRFTTRDYFWPIPESELLSNKNLNQFPGW
ncbi:MAG: RagB/SusD family nutrient uptake outer membrane protein [Paludibacter sp.]|nr:RagB/SusD family nutrient uptake outer membrane protein [Paludibacter sp.]